MPTVQPLLRATLGRIYDRVMATSQKKDSNGLPAHHGDFQILPGQSPLQRVLNTLGSLTGPSFSSEGRTTAGDMAVIEQAGHETVHPVAKHVSGDVEQGQPDV